MEPESFAIALLCGTKSLTPPVSFLSNYLSNQSVDSSGRAPSFNTSVRHAPHAGAAGCWGAVNNTSHFTTCWTERNVSLRPCTLPSTRD